MLINNDCPSKREIGRLFLSNLATKAEFRLGGWIPGKQSRLIKSDGRKVRTA
jgi:hypothetical protein